MIEYGDVSPDEVAWLLLALLGIALHVAGLLRYGRQRPKTDDEARVRRMGLMTSFSHIGIKCVFLVGAVLAMTQPWPTLGGTEMGLLYVWRAGILGVLVALDIEAVYLRANREVLARARLWRDGEGRRAQEQQDRIEATGEESAERLRRGHIGDRERP